MMERVPITTAGYKRLTEELKNLKSVERPNIIRAIEEARSHGDLSENAEYHSAKEKQGFIEGRILELEDKLGRAEIIDVTKLHGSEIRFGATVKLLEDDTDEEKTYQIVGTDESDIARGLLSITSPLAKSLIGKKPNDSIDVNTPGGSKAYTIVEVKYL